MSIFILRYLAEKINAQKMSGNLSRLTSVLAKSTIDLNPHQIHAALYAFNSPLARGAILADEVGLGKTIEAGIIIAQLWAEGKQQILILCPASLRTQWQDELITKFGLESEVWDGKSFLNAVTSGEKTPLTYPGIFIVSYQFAYKNLTIIGKQDWNVVIIDEAHRFRRVYRGKDASKMAYDIRDVVKNKPKVLLTATPLQNSLEELYGIASFIDDKLLGSPYSFKTRFIDPIKQQNELSRNKLAELSRLIKGEEIQSGDSISGIITRTLRKQVLEYVPFRDRTSLTFDFTPTDQEIELYDKVSTYLQKPELASISSTQRNLMILVYRKLLASSSFAIAPTIKKLVDFLKQELILRNQETIESKNASLFSDEDLEEEFAETELEGIVKNIQSTKSRVDKKFTNEAIQMEIKELEEYYDLAKEINYNTKGDELIKALQKLFIQAREKGWPEKAVVFTESTRTQEYIAGLFRDAGILFTQFNGSNNSPEARKTFQEWSREFPENAIIGNYATNIRQALIHDFKTNSQVLLTTEAGAEGINLQFCNIVINFDLPWNPQRIEQRIGRCHRYGQKYQVVVANFLNTRNYADRRVLELLNEKLNLFDGLFGSSDEVLGALESGIDFEKKILDIYQKCKRPEQFDQAFADLQERLKETISSVTLEYRKLLLENTDQSVANLFKQTAIETKDVLNEFDSDLLRFCKYFFSTDLKPTEDPCIYHLYNFDFPIVFRELKDKEIGKLTRAHKELPLIKQALDQAIELQTKPIPSILFNLSHHKNKITKLQETVGKDGYIYLWKLTIQGFENETLIVPLVFLREEKGYQELDFETANQLFTVDLADNLKTFEVSPINRDSLLNKWNTWKNPVITKYQRRNERLIDRETNRVNRYYDDYTLRLDDRIVKYETEKTDINRKRANMTDFEERRNLQKRMQEVEYAIEKVRIEQIKMKQEAAEKRKQEIEELWKKLDFHIAEELIAITHFEIN